MKPPQQTPPPPPPVQERTLLIERESQPPSKKTNPFLKALKLITYPFRKLGQWIGILFLAIVQQIIHSTVSFILGVLLLSLVIVLSVVFVIALLDSNFNIAQAVSLALERVLDFVRNLF